MSDWLSIVPYIYIGLQSTLVLITSVLGVFYVRAHLDIQRQWLDQNSQIQEIRRISKMKMFTLYCRITWKMRSVYSSFFVHIFDVFTDYLIVIQWFELGRQEKETGEDIVQHVDPIIMGYCGIAVIVTHKIASVVAFWSKEKNLARCILVFFDLLIFQEIYVSHLNIVHNIVSGHNITNNIDSNYNNNSNINNTGGGISINKIKTEGIDPTTSFKFVRNLEAVFESIPQAVLQTVFLMRTKWEFDNNNNSQIFVIISFLSILQSIISMTNAILKNDNAEMTLPKWKKYKKRLPPTIYFLKHGLWRLSEIIYRIGLLSLIWTVCEGEIFSFVLLFELLLLIIMVIPETTKSIGNKRKTVSIKDVSQMLLRLQAIIILPSELIYKYDTTYETGFGGFCCENEDQSGLCIEMAIFTCCCYQPCVCVTTVGCEDTSTWVERLCERRLPIKYKDRHYFVPTVRVGISFVEWIFLIVYGLLGQDGNRSDYLLNPNHGFVVFILGLIMFGIYIQYLRLFPNFSLPRGVSARSVDGLAFNGELEELKRLTGQSGLFTYNTLVFALAGEQYHVADWLEKEKGISWKARMDDTRRAGSWKFDKNTQYYEIARDTIDARYWRDVEIKRPPVGDAARRRWHEPGGRKKILFLGAGASGKVTTFKQLMYIFGDGFSQVERMMYNVTRDIHDCIIFQMQHVISNARDLKYQFTPEVDECVRVMDSIGHGAEFTSEIANAIDQLWKNDKIKDAFANRRTVTIADSAAYFFEHIHRIADADYSPTKMDILLCRMPQTGIREETFEIDGRWFYVYNTGGQRAERRKWIHCFDCVDVVCDFVSLIHFDVGLYEDQETNAAHEDFQLWNDLVHSRNFKTRKTSMVVIFTQSDLLKEKIKEKDFRIGFPDYQGDNSYDDIVKWMKEQYLKKADDKYNEVYFHVMNCLDETNVERVFKDIAHMATDTTIPGHMICDF